MDKQTLVAALKAKREASGLSLRGLSSLIGVSFSSLARIERGEGEPDSNSAVRIVNWLGAEADSIGLVYENVASVHFRAAKNVQSETVGHLLQAASAIKEKMGKGSSALDSTKRNSRDEEEDLAAPLTKDDMEELAAQLRADISLGEQQSFDSLKLKIEGVTVLTLDQLDTIPIELSTHLLKNAVDEWSAMSIPLDLLNDEWAVLRNDRHKIERQRVTYLEECWHIMLGHQLTKIAKISDSYGRTFSSSEEDEAFYLAAASLLPKSAVEAAVKNGEPAKVVARKFGVSEQLVEYRIKRLGLWAKHKGKKITLE